MQHCVYHRSCWKSWPRSEEARVDVWFQLSLILHLGQNLKQRWMMLWLNHFLSSRIIWFSQIKKPETKTNDAFYCQTKSLFMFPKFGMALASYIIGLLTSTLEECSKDVPLTLEPSVPCLSLQTWTWNTFFKTPQKYQNTFKISKVSEDLSTEPLVGAACCWEGGGARPRIFVTWQWCKW